ncbi:MAG TPA: hypothetical protein QGF58_10825 [Myxococcota bacterium]|nr:hypothetical protein [Myxococcota bacterium]
MNARILAAAVVLLAVGAGGLWVFWPAEPEPEPELEVDRPMTEKEQIELMMSIGYIQQEDLDELPETDPPTE